MTKDLGEPLEAGYVPPLGPAVVANKVGVTLNETELKTVVKRANALRGCPNPKAFVDAVRKARAEFDGGLRDKILDGPEFAWLKEEPK